MATKMLRAWLQITHFLCLPEQPRAQLDGPLCSYGLSPPLSPYHRLLTVPQQGFPMLLGRWSFRDFLQFDDVALWLTVLTRTNTWFTCAFPTDSAGAGTRLVLQLLLGG